MNIHKYAEKNKEREILLANKQAYDRLIISKYEMDFPDDKTLRSLCANKKKAELILACIYGWLVLPNGFEYRYNYRIDNESNEIIYDTHVIKFEDGDYEAEDYFGRNFINMHLQLFDTLENIYFQFEKQANIYVKDDLFDYLKEDYKLLSDKKYIAFYTNRIETSLNFKESDSPLFINFVLRWLNRLNEIDVVTNINENEIMYSLLKIGKGLSIKYAYDEFEYIFDKFIHIALNIFKLYHPQGSILANNIVSIISKHNGNFYNTFVKKLNK